MLQDQYSNVHDITDELKRYKWERVGLKMDRLWRDSNGQRARAIVQRVSDISKMKAVAENKIEGNCRETAEVWQGLKTLGPINFSKLLPRQVSTTV